VESILGLIIRQLFARKPSLCFKSTYEASLSERNLPLQRRKDLLESLIPQFRGITVVIDALDEFSLQDEDQVFLMDSLIEIARKFDPEQFRFMVTSREAPNIWDALYFMKRGQVKIEADKVDLSLMVDKWLERKPLFRRLLETQQYNGKKLKEHTIVKLQEKSRGV
jgi:hypothetical protein